MICFDPFAVSENRTSKDSSNTGTATDRATGGKEGDNQGGGEKAKGKGDRGSTKGGKGKTRSKKGGGKGKSKKKDHSTGSVAKHGRDKSGRGRGTDEGGDVMDDVRAKQRSPAEQLLSYELDQYWNTCWRLTSSHLSRAEFCQVYLNIQKAVNLQLHIAMTSRWTEPSDTWRVDAIIGCSKCLFVVFGCMCKGGCMDAAVRLCLCAYVCLFNVHLA